LLDWGNEVQDLDLHVVQVNSLDTRITCETFFNNMNGCKDTTLNRNIKGGGVNGSEIVKVSNVAANSRFTYMLFAVDNSISGPLLSTSEATMTITDGSFAMVEEMPLFTEDTVAGSKYWFAGCLELVGESFNYVKVDKFSRESPYHTEKLFCDSLFKKESGVTPLDPFCEDIDIQVIVHDSLTNDAVQDASVSIVRIVDDIEQTITEGTITDEDGKTASHINQNGHYIVKIERGEYIASKRDLEVNCDRSECERCHPTILIPLSPVLEPDTIRLTLSWAEEPNDLDIYAYRRTRSDWSNSCLTYYSKKTDCGTAILDLDNLRGGNNGAETITFHDVENQEDAVYMIFVQNYGYNPSAEQFRSSNAHISITDGLVSSDLDMGVLNYNGEKNWLAGCLKMVGNSYQFMPLNAFFNTRPDEEVPDMCLDSFGFVSPTTKRPWYKFWG